MSANIQPINLMCDEEPGDVFKTPLAMYHPDDWVIPSWSLSRQAFLMDEEIKQGIELRLPSAPCGAHAFSAIKALVNQYHLGSKKMLTKDDILPINELARKLYLNTYNTASVSQSVNIMFNVMLALVCAGVALKYHDEIYEYLAPSDLTGSIRLKNGFEIADVCSLFKKYTKEILKDLKWITTHQVKEMEIKVLEYVGYHIHRLEIPVYNDEWKCWRCSAQSKPELFAYQDYAHRLCAKCKAFV